MLGRIIQTASVKSKLGRNDLSSRERRVLLAIIRTAIPACGLIEAPDRSSIERFARQFASMQLPVRAGLRTTLWAVELGPLVSKGRPFSRLKEKSRLKYLQRWINGPSLQRLALKGLLAPIKITHFDDARIFEAMKCTYTIEPPKQEERQRWRQSILSLEDLESDEELEADVVVVGTGAGGAVVAKELAERGFAVAMLEAGRHFTRKDFDGRPMKAFGEMYYGRGMTFSLGNTPVALPTGRTVGGTTTVNSGTCLRLPDAVMETWRKELGLREFSLEGMAPHFDRVESIMQVAPADWQYLGGCARVVKRGCEALGFTDHGPLPRNAPDCDGQGVCCFGCPTDAKRSTNVSYVPSALQNHATLFTDARVDRILIENGRACGVVAKCRIGEPGLEVTRRLTVRAKAVVIAAGAFGTPSLLLKNEIANSSGMVGRNLSVHPSVGVMAEFDEEIAGWNGIPQGYSLADFADKGMIFEGGFTPMDLASAAHDFIGPEYSRVMERFNHLAAFGFMIRDQSRGRVRLGPTGSQMIFYDLNKSDLAKIRRGTEILCELFFAAGAKRVFQPVHGHDIINDFRDLEKMRRTRLKASDFGLVAYHPLGTARLGASPKESVAGADHETHDVPNLYIIDGSCVPSSLGVNPQLTIMAMATRAAEILARRL